MRICTIEGCNDKHYGKGYCGRHYTQVYRNGQITRVEKTPKICTIEGCNDKHSGKGYCARHRTQILKYGKILSEEYLKSRHKNKFIEYEDHIGIILTDKDGNFKAEGLFDKNKKKYIEKHKWHQSTYGYPATSIEGKTLNLHNFLYPGKIMDHINRNKLDNRSCNLRECDRKQNSHNRKLHINNTSGISGVHWHKIMNKWRASITVNYKVIILGFFEDIKKAKKARLNAEKKYFGEFAPTK